MIALTGSISIEDRAHGVRAASVLPGGVATPITRRGRSAAPWLLGRVAMSSVSLALLILGVRTGALALWRLFVCGGTAVAYLVLSRRDRKETSGRVNAAINVFGFVGMLAGQ